MKKYIEAWETATISQTHAGEYGTVSICTDDLICGEAEEKKNRVVSGMVRGMLYRQAHQRKTNNTPIIPRKERKSHEKRIRELLQNKQD